MTTAENLAIIESAKRAQAESITEQHFPNEISEYQYADGSCLRVNFSGGYPSFEVIEALSA